MHRDFGLIGAEIAVIGLCTVLISEPKDRGFSLTVQEIGLTLEIMIVFVGV